MALFSVGRIVVEEERHEEVEGARGVVWGMDRERLAGIIVLCSWGVVVLSLWSLLGYDLLARVDILEWSVEINCWNELRFWRFNI